MHMYVGLRCPNRQCKAFNVWKEIRPGDPEPTVGVLEMVHGTCPACKSGYSTLATDMMILESEKPAHRKE